MAGNTGALALLDRFGIGSFSLLDPPVDQWLQGMAAIPPLFHIVRKQNHGGCAAWRSDISRHRPVRLIIAEAVTRCTFLSLAIAGFLLPATGHATEADLLQRIDKMGLELEQLKAQLKQMQEDKARESKAKEQPTQTLPPPAYTAAPAPGDAQTSVFGYGEINYNRPRRNTAQAQADVRRAVIGIGHRFNEKTEFISEFEWEHAIASATDRGEAAVEQLYISHHLTDSLDVKAGLFLIPLGILNERHEPPTFYGVERNFVETAIIPSTLREIGVGLRGTTADFLQWDVGVTTGPDLSKWDAASADGRESPLGSIHQEGQLAKAKDFQLYGAVNYRGIPGFLAGGGLTTGKIGQGQPGFAANNARATLWDLHTNWKPGSWDLTALYARGSLSNTADFNLTVAGQPTPIPKEFWGWYTQAAYRMWSQGDYSLSPFIRYERFNTAAKYEALPPGLGIDPAPTELVTTVGVNFKVHPNVVFKADYQKFKVDDTRDRFDLGIGFLF